MDKEIKVASLDVIPQDALTALLMFFVEAASQNDDVDIAYHKRNGGEPFTYGRDFNVTSVYPPGLYLDVTIRSTEWTYDYFEQYKPFLRCYTSEDFDDDDEDIKSTIYSFRLTDSLNALAQTVKETDDD